MAANERRERERRVEKKNSSELMEEERGRDVGGGEVRVDIDLDLEPELLFLRFPFYFRHLLLADKVRLFPPPPFSLPLAEL